MTKTINLKTKTARNRLDAYREPHWQKFPPEILKGGSLGFRKSPENDAETWHGRVYLDGTYHKTNLGTVRPDFEYKEAFKAALAWAQKLKDAGPVMAKAFTLEDVIDHYLLKLQGNSSARFMDKRRQAAKRLDALIPQSLLRKKANSLIDRDINNVQREYQQRENKYTKRPIAPDSVNRVMTHLIAALNHGYKNSMIASNKAWKHYERLPESIEKRRGKSYITVADRDAFIKACPEPLKAFVQAMNIMGARPSELRRVLVSDVDFDNLDPAQRGVRLITYKGKGSVRRFPLPEGTPIRELFAAQIKDKQPDDFVFTAKNGKGWGHANLLKHHNAVRDNGKFSKAFETYVWRHCRISDWAKVPFPAPEVARLAGTSLEHIQRNYYKADSDIQAKMAGL
jgi:integrase